MVTPRHESRSYPIAELLPDVVRRAAVAVLAIALTVLGCGDPSDPGNQGSLAIGSPLPPDASLHDALRHPDVFERMARIARILETSEPSDLDALLEDFEQAPLDQGDVEYSLFMNWWARFDPMAAYGYYERSQRLDHPRVVLEVIRMWARSAPAEAANATSTGALDATMPSVLPWAADAIVVGWFESGNPGLEEWILQLDSASDAGMAATRAYARVRLLRDGNDATLEWIRQSTFPPDHKRMLWAGAITQLARHEPETAIEWLAAAKETGLDVNTFTARIARHWAFRSPQKAMEWLTTLPDSAEGMRAVQEVAARWVRRDPDGFDAWLVAQTEGKGWVSALRTWAFQQRAERASYQIDWPKYMRDAKQFPIATEDSLQAWILQRWRFIDSAAAEAWVEANPEELSAEAVRRSRSFPQERAKIEKILASLAKSEQGADAK